MRTMRTTTTTGDAPRFVALAGTLGGELRRWPARGWWVAVATAVSTVALIAIPTDLINTQFFARE